MSARKRFKRSPVLTLSFHGDKTDVGFLCETLFQNRVIPYVKTDDLLLLHAYHLVMFCVDAKFRYIDKHGSLP